jgi:hypothetical protein
VGLRRELGREKGRWGLSVVRWLVKKEKGGRRGKKNLNENIKKSP